MEKLCPTGAKMLKRVDVPIVHIKESVRGKFNILLHSSGPLFDCRIELRLDTSVMSYWAGIGMGQDSERDVKEDGKGTSEKYGRCERQGAEGQGATRKRRYGKGGGTQITQAKKVCLLGRAAEAGEI